MLIEINFFYFLFPESHSELQKKTYLSKNTNSNLKIKVREFKKLEESSITVKH